MVSLPSCELHGSVEGFVGRPEGTSTAGLRSLQVCPVLCHCLPEAEVGLLAGGGQGTGPVGLGWAEEGEPVPTGPFGSPLAALASSVGR